MKTSDKFDRSQEDVGNSVHMEHVNLRVPDQQIATLFYVTGLGLTREPFLMSGLENMWINIGRHQFHLGPHGVPQVLRGHIGLVIPDRLALLQRLELVRERLSATYFDVQKHDDHIEVICPWGNRFRCYEPDGQRFGRILLGIPYVEFQAPIGTTDGIVRFYQQALKLQAQKQTDDKGSLARVKIGLGQHLIFRETNQDQPSFDGHHVQIYLNDFSGPHRWLLDRNLITEESDRYQYRFNDIIDPDTGLVLFVVEHEVRSMTHPLFARPLVNRNPIQTNRAYAPGHDEGQWGMPWNA